MFREGRPSSLRLHFGLRFGVILGTKFATILLSGRPGPQKGVQKAMEKTDRKKFMRGETGRPE